MEPIIYCWLLYTVLKNPKKWNLGSRAVLGWEPNLSGQVGSWFACLGFNRQYPFFKCLALGYYHQWTLFKNTPKNGPLLLLHYFPFLEDCVTYFVKPYKTTLITGKNIWNQIQEFYGNNLGFKTPKKVFLMTIIIIRYYCTFCVWNRSVIRPNM